MSRPDRHRVYLDWNASAPLRPEARAAMIDAFDVVGNPSSVHAEGRAARAIVENARRHVAALVGCEPEQVVFTSGATEAASLVIGSQDWKAIALSTIDHDAVHGASLQHGAPIVLHDGPQALDDAFQEPTGQGGESAFREQSPSSLISVPVGNGETGIVSAVDPGWLAALSTAKGPVLRDATQGLGRIAFSQDASAPRVLNWVEWGRPDFALVSAHKIGGPKGVGALIVSGASTVASPGGGQESGRRSGTENVAGIAGFGAAAEAAKRDLDRGAWDHVVTLRDRFEARLLETAPTVTIFGADEVRLPNTCCFAIPGWAGETQVMQMDLAGFAISAGSACSSGKVNRASRVLKAMGYDDVTATSAIRVSIGPTTTEQEMSAFADAWTQQYERFRRKAA